MTKQDNALDVWLDDGLSPACQVGTLAHDRGQIRFHYERGWLKDSRAFALSVPFCTGCQWFSMAVTGFSDGAKAEP